MQTEQGQIADPPAKPKATRRDEFPAGTKELLAKRVAFRCSNPNCRSLTVGPMETDGGSVNIGIAAHIAAAAPRGPRYDPSMNRNERTSPDNGIWLCSRCSILIDRDHTSYTPDLLRAWKRQSEVSARMAIEQPSAETATTTSDRELMLFFAQCFDRPAFQDTFHRERILETFDQAIEDTITALNTGALRARDGVVLQRGKGKAYLRSPGLRQSMDLIVELLRSIRARYAYAIATGEVRVDPASGGQSETHYCQSEDLANWMDLTRIEVVKTFGTAAAEVGVQGPTMPFSPRRHGY